MSDFWSAASSISIFMCANSDGSGKTARMLTWAFAGRLCDKYHSLMSWLKYINSHIKKNKEDGGEPSKFIVTKLTYQLNTKVIGLTEVAFNSLNQNAIFQGNVQSWYCWKDKECW